MPTIGLICRQSSILWDTAGEIRLVCMKMANATGTQEKLYQVWLDYASEENVSWKNTWTFVGKYCCEVEQDKSDVSIVFNTMSVTGNLQSGSEMEQDTMVLAPTTTMSSALLLSVENFSQRISLIREVRYAETKENGQRKLNNNNVIIKHSQGPLVLS